MNNKGSKWNENSKERIIGKGNPFYGQKHSQKTKILMRQKAMERIDKGLNKTMFKKGIHISPKTEFKKGRKHTNKFKRFMSQKLKGKRCYNWKGGISFEPYGIDFNNKLKKKIKKRDNYRCQECSEKLPNKMLYIHHIDYNKKNNKPENLVSLCPSCHSQTNFKREDWTVYFKNKMGAL